VAVIRAAGTQEQRVWRSRLDSAEADTAGSKLSPCIVVVGAVAGPDAMLVAAPGGAGDGDEGS
jgi:siroheme synthase